ncbi:uncharacterized protein KQ657_000885 [Scheffersomyces spartinae]|uniref:HECT-type E3 ubiquitin transferase n=1 Tax=Scheffersomyces spartinae TaxID=45513 RepID=A0A9P7V8B1_9ASCO|nr:uncharacterized protein KQ657_000885 [Scheffersomyces spartinae]KAG7193131.1 hypothetical protein KQ657_000885 [Scheffersomyces spartinae]
MVKRVVNLGNSRGARSLNFLQQTQLERQKRERERAREHAAIVLQSATRRHLDLTQAAKEIYDTWIRTEEFRDQNEWNEWLVEFGFLSTKRTIDDYELVAKLEAEIDRNNQHLQIDRRHIYIVIRGLSCILLRDSSSHIALKMILRMVHSCGDNDNGIVRFPRGTIKNVLGALLESNSKLVLDIVFHVNVREGSEGFMEFMADEDQWSLEPNTDYQRIINANAIEFVRVSDTDPKRLISTVSNIITVFGDSSSWTEEDYATLFPLLAKMDFQVALSHEDEDEDKDEDDDIDDEDKLNLDYQEESTSSKEECLEVDAKIMNNIYKLYAPHIVQYVVSCFRTNNESTTMYLNVLVCLLKLVPQFKDRIGMFITLVPGFHKKMLNILQDSQLYTAITDDSRDIIPIEYSEDDASGFWNSVYVFHESYSYWLLVSNDFESFNEDKLTREDIVPYLKFLKRLCISLVLNLCPERLRCLKEISIVLLNQLYQKNSRLKLIPDNENFWRLDSNQINVAAIVQLIQQEEKLQIDEDADNSLEKQSHKYRRFSTLSKLKGSTSHSTARLELLRKLPFLVPFMDRVKIFKRLSTKEGTEDFFIPESRLSGDIRRANVLEDAYTHFHKAGSLLKAKISVTFHNEFGVEAGIDGGGLTKEFLTAVIADGFSKTTYFKTTPEHTVYPNEDIYYRLSKNMDVEESHEQLKMIKFLGNIIGKCFYENVLVDIAFAPFFLSKIGYSQKNSINDLYYYDREYFENLIKLSKLPTKEIEDLDLYFTINVKVNDRDLNYELIPDGANTKVNSANVLNYIHQIANFKLNQSLYIQTKYFVEGLSKLINIDRLAMFSPSELQMLISGGDNPDVDLRDWKLHVSYGGYLEDDLTIQLFWDVVENEFTAKQRCELLKFVTSVSRAPLLGFGSLSPMFGIRNSGREVDRLPTASTCVNLLKLPDYQDRATLKRKLLYVIESESGFDLS